MLGSAPRINWKDVFGPNYRNAEKQMVRTRALADTDVTAWVNAMDVFDDWLFDALYAHDTSLGRYTLGEIGSVLNGGRLKAKYPAVYEMAESIHGKRYGSALSHPKEKRTGRPTRMVKYAYLKTAKGLIRKAMAELQATW